MTVTMAKMASVGIFYRSWSVVIRDVQVLELYWEALVAGTHQVCCWLNLKVDWKWFRFSKYKGSMNESKTEHCRSIKILDGRALQLKSPFLELSAKIENFDFPFSVEITLQKKKILIFVIMAPILGLQQDRKWLPTFPTSTKHLIFQLHFLSRKWDLNILIP